MSMSRSMAHLLADTVLEAMTTRGWRKVVASLSPASLAEMEALLARCGRGTAGTAGEAAGDARALGERRVVILVEPEGSASE